MIFSKNITQNDALLIGDALGVDWKSVDIKQFRRGLEVELEHGLINKKSNVTNDDMYMTGKIALAHLNELNDYYTRLDMLETAKIKVSQTNTFSNNQSSTTQFLTGIAVGVGLFSFIKYLSNKKTLK